MKIYKTAAINIILLFLSCNMACFAYSSDISGQERNLTYAVNKNPSSVDASLHLIKFYLDNGQDTKAMIELNRIQNKATGNGKFFVLASKLLLRRGILDEAEDMAKKAVKLNYNNADAFIALGDIYLEKFYSLDNSAENIEVKKAFLKRAFDSYYTAQNYNAASPVPHIGLANTYYMNAQKSLALDEILKAKELSTNNAEAYYLLGEYYYKIKEYGKAKTYFEKSLAAGMTSKYKTYYLLGTLNEQDGLIKNAQQNYLQSLKLKPDHLESQQNLDRLIKTTYKEVSLLSDKKTSTKDLFSNLNDELNNVMQADYYLVLDEFTRARDSYINVLNQNPKNINAISGLAELYYAKWAEGFENSADFVNDSKYILKIEENSRIVIPLTKFKIINETKLPEPVRQKLISLSVSETYDFYDLLNEVRAEFLLGNYEESHEKLKKLLSFKLSNYEKFKVLKSLCCDHDYDEALLLIEELKKTYYHNEELKPISDRIAVKFKTVDEKLNQAIALYKDKNDLSNAEYVMKQALRYLPTNKKAYLHYAYLLEKQKRYQEAMEKVNICYKLHKLYPDKDSKVEEKNIKDLINSLNRKYNEAESKK